MFSINVCHWIHSGGPTSTLSDLFLTSIDRAKESVRNFFSMNKFFYQNILWRTMNNVVGARVMKFQYIAPIFWTFASKCIIIQIIGKNKQFFMLWNFRLTLYSVFHEQVFFCDILSLLVQALKVWVAQFMLAKLQYHEDFFFLSFIWRIAFSLDGHASLG